MGERTATHPRVDNITSSTITLTTTTTATTATALHSALSRSQYLHVLQLFRSRHSAFLFTTTNPDLSLPNWCLFHLPAGHPASSMPPALPQGFSAGKTPQAVRRAPASLRFSE
ncbi:hypothetical protein E2C01_098270 [Portunus trituberculatus]|uniref:Uncharacterized protein n=1 Tax=Portunus trituberculatus TaxID=210409 RepID=A0A5B7K7U0_PORTR|nr:hypothetical protein [Portunus trituberculatus]